MASSIAPVPPPPPPPPLLNTPKILANGGRTPKNSNNVVSVRATQSQERSPFAGVYPETLQHAAAGLRKTQHREPIPSREPEPLLRRSHQLADRRHWEDFEINDSLDQHSAGEPIHAPQPGPNQSLPIGVGVGYTIPVNVSQHIYQQPLPHGPIHNPINNNNSFSYSYNSSSNNAPNNFNPNFQQSPYIMPDANNKNTSASSNSSSYTIFSNNSSPSVINQQQQHDFNSKQPTRAFSQNSPLSQPTHIYQRPDVITNPQSYIHQYATQTPASSLLYESPSGGGRPAATNKTTTTTTTTRINTIGGAMPYQQTSHSSTTNNQNFLTKELRDAGLTERQKYSNQFQTSLLRGDRNAPNSMHNLYHETQRYTSSVPDPVNSLIQDMEYRMRTNYGGGGGSSSTNVPGPKSGSSDFCAKCGSQIVGDTPGVTALGNAYHVTCFACDVCQKQLAGCSFYSVDGKNLCQVDYMNSLEKCEKCLTPITQKILRAMGKPFHPECFACPACSKSLDGIPFTVDKENLAYCLDCYHERFSPRCAVCLKAIAPSGNETEVARVIAMDRSYHIDCYRCEDCGLKLNSKIEGQGCYPLENHLFCKSCNLNRLKTVN